MKSELPRHVREVIGPMNQKALDLAEWAKPALSLVASTSDGEIFPATRDEAMGAVQAFVSFMEGDFATLLQTKQQELKEIGEECFAHCLAQHLLVVQECLPALRGVMSQQIELETIKDRARHAKHALEIIQDVLALGSDVCDVAAKANC